MTAQGYNFHGEKARHLARRLRQLEQRNARRAAGAGGGGGRYR